MDGPNQQEKWSYASVVEMCVYLSMNSGLDIAFAVHQCAHFTSCPKQCHVIALT